MRYGRVYLSIDADFWNGIDTTPLIASMEQMLLRVKQLKVPILFAENHEQLLMHMNWFDYETLVNVDYHSDLLNNSPDRDPHMDLNCGTWGNFVKKEIREYGQFVWVYPRSKCRTVNEGYVHDFRSINPFHRRAGEESLRVSGWYEAREIHQHIPPIVWKTTLAVGICESPSYCYPGVLEKFHKAAKRVGLNLKRYSSGWAQRHIYPPKPTGPRYEIGSSRLAYLNRRT
jgi:hypothetical protein